MKNIFNKNINYKNKAGFSVVEVLIACMIMSMIILALMSAATRGIGLSINALKKVQASNLIEEGIEVIKATRDNNWTTIANLNTETKQYLSFDSNSNTWSLGETPVALIDGFEREVIFYPVYRDSNDDIASVGTLDSGIKKVTVKVSWAGSNMTNSKEITFYLANIFN